MSHKVNHYVEHEHVDNLVREIAKIAGKSLCRLMVKRVAIMLLDKGAFGVDGDDLKLASEGVEHQ